MVNATPWPLYPQERPGTHCIGGWVGPRAGLDGCGKSPPTRIRSPDHPAHRIPVGITHKFPVTKGNFCCLLKMLSFAPVYFCYISYPSLKCWWCFFVCTYSAFLLFIIYLYQHTHTHTHTHTHIYIYI